MRVLSQFQSLRKNGLFPMQIDLLGGYWMNMLLSAKKIVIDDVCESTFANCF
jgi:hypothetical protein